MSTHTSMPNNVQERGLISRSNQPFGNQLTKIGTSGELPCLKNILSYLNVIDLCLMNRVCRLWKNLIEKDPLIFENVNLELLPSNVQVLNLLKIFSRDKHISSLRLPKNASASDTSYLLLCLPHSLNILHVCNINMEFSKVFTRRFDSLQKLHLTNVAKRKKPFDETELKALVLMASNVSELELENTPINDKALDILLQQFHNLRKLSLLNAPQLTDATLNSIATNCQQLTHLELGGSPTTYNLNFTKEGLQALLQTPKPLEVLKMYFVAKVGDKVINFLTETYQNTLRQLDIVRNCYEECSKVSDTGLQYLVRCSKLTSLQIVYSRKFRDKAHKYLAQLHNLRYLGLKECPIQEDLSILMQGCHQLQEVDFSGDSWVNKEAFYGLSKLPKLRILHMGHFEHGDQNCDQYLHDYPPEGMFIEGLFKQSAAFPSLEVLFLQANYVRLVKARPKLFIRYTKDDFIMNQK